MADKKVVPAVKVVLGTGKVVILRQPDLNDQETAMQIAAPKAKDSPMLLMMMAQKELTKILLIEIDGKAPSKIEIEKISSLFTLPEYNQLQKVVMQLSGGDPAMGESQIEIVSSGVK